MTVLLTLDRATIGYVGNPVLREVTLEIVAGEAIAVFGANGCGKTTFLKTLAGILPPLGGHLRFSMHHQEQSIQVGYIPQRATLSTVLPLSVREVVELGTYGRLRPWQGIGRQETERVEWAMKETGTAAIAREPYPNLSGGQQQRVLIARALAAAPEMLLLDEPLASLDQQSARAMVDLLAKLRADTHITLLWADHFTPGMHEVVQDVLLIEDGGLVRHNIEAFAGQQAERSTWGHEGSG